MLYVGLVAGTIVSNIAAHQANIDPFRTYVATVLLIPLALAGARLLFVAAHWRHFWRQPHDIFSPDQGGAAQYGGVLLAVPLSVPLLAALDLSFGTFWDVSTFTILVGMIPTRIGCLLNGCCAGRPVRKWGVLLPDHLGVRVRRVPTQLLEAALAGVLLAAAISIWPAVPFPGALFLLASGGYATGRLILESLRDQTAATSRVTLQHAISLLIAVASFTALTAGWPK